MKKLLLALVLSAFASYANAATCFWVGGTGSWSTTNGVSWASGTGGTASTCAATGGIPKQAGDVATFDALSGGGTVTVAANMSGTTFATITMGAFTGTLDFSANNPTITLTSGFNLTGAGTRTLSLGSSTIHLTGVNAFVWDATTVTGLTFNAGTSNITLIPASFSGKATIVTGGLTYSTITLGPTTSTTNIALNTNGSTVANFVLNGPLVLFIPSMTISNAISWAGTASSPIVIQNSTSASISTVTLSAAGNTINWAAMGGVTFATNTPVASNSFSLGNVANATINNPVVGGGGGHIIGG